MNPRLMQLIKENTPKIDPRVGEGLAYYQSKSIPDFVDHLFRMNSIAFPEGLKYLGYEKASPIEGYKILTKPTSNSVRKYDINRNDVRVVNYLFEWEGKIIKKGIYLPFISRFGFIHLNNVKYIITPVVSDGIVTVKPNSIFIKLIKTKLWFERLNYQFHVDGTREYAPVYYSDIHNKPSDGNLVEKMVKMKCTLVHYLVCKFGLTQTLKMFNIKNFIMMSKEDFVKEQNNYPKEKWVVIESTDKKPARTYLYKFYNPQQFLFLVDRKEFESSPSAKSVFCTIMYVLDHFTSPKRMNPSTIDNTDAWRSMMGETIHSTDEHYAVIKEFINKHMLSLDGYVDDMVRNDFSRIGYPPFETLYHLFVFIINEFNQMVSEVSRSSESNTVYGKQLQVLQYLLFNITKAVNNSYYKLGNLKNEQLSNPKKQIRPDDIVNCLAMIRTDEILRIKEHAEIIPVEDPTDLPLLKLGRLAVLQEKSDKIRTSNTTFDVNDPKNILHESLIETSGALDMSKSDPSGRNRINPYVTLSEDFTVIPNPELKDKIDEIASLLYS